MNDFLNNDFLYGMIVCRLSQRSTLVFMLKDLQRQGHFTAVRVSKDKAIAIFADSGRAFTFRYQEKLDFERIVTWNSWPYSHEIVLKGLALIEPYLVITVKRIIFVNNEEELDTLARKSHYTDEDREYIATSRGTWLNEHQDIVLNLPVMWETVREIEPDESRQLLPFAILLFDILLHEIYHAFQYNPLLRMKIEGKRMDDIEEEANAFVEKRLCSLLNEIGIPI